jgi:hypothetical protein
MAGVPGKPGKMNSAQVPAVEGRKQSFLQRLHSPKLIIWWSVAWALGTFGLAPLVNYVTPFLNSGYANYWTPSLYWRLVLYWHGAIFIPWVTVLAVLAVMKFHLDQLKGIPGRLIRESIFIGGFFAIPIASVAGIFDVYDRFLFGIPLWSQIFAFLIADEMAIALIISMLIYPRRSGGGYLKAGMPYYTVLIGVFGALIAAMMGHVGGWITWFGPSPQPVANYINGTMWPVTGYYNDTAVQSFTFNVVGSHSHLMLVSLMAGVVALAATFFGFYELWGRNAKRVANFGFAWMNVALLAALSIYVIAGVGNYQIPSFFVSATGAVAGDDLTTGMVGLGAVFVLTGLLAYSRKGLATTGGPLIRDPLFLSVVVAWITIYLVIPVTGFYINFHENFFQGSGIAFDDAFNRFHQDFGFFLLPALVTLVLALESFKIPFRARRYMGYLLISGIGTAFVFGEAYTLSAAPYTTPYVGSVYTFLPIGTLFLNLAILGGVVIATGALAAAIYVKRTPTAGT